MKTRVVYNPSADILEILKARDALALLGELLPFISIHLHYRMQLMITLGRKCILQQQKDCKLSTSQSQPKKIRQWLDSSLSVNAQKHRH
ncbi:hypothetical protein NPIL_4241 [Nephila pilipes]|uniref:Uncharacterized protein n=1 Tax=Nephila pilipes TaxID=299642 RepID=A0A8X6K2D3_NEPPI|nr:hypothetical protein NPIL_4241 [Nephila pilipes]